MAIVVEAASADDVASGVRGGFSRRIDFDDWYEQFEDCVRFRLRYRLVAPDDLRQPGHERLLHCWTRSCTPPERGRETSAGQPTRRAAC